MPTQLQQPDAFLTLKLENWRQFASVDVDLTGTVTILTGANASGKTTILNILGRHFSWQAQFLGTPRRGQWGIDSHHENDVANVGTLVYSSGIQAPLQVTGGGGAETYLSFPQSQVHGLYLASHRTPSRYQRLETIPASFSTADTIFNQYFAEISNRFTGAYSSKTALGSMKEALLAAAVYGQGNDSVDSNEEAAATWTGFQSVLRSVLPPSFGFRSLKASSPEIILQTQGGDFLLDSASGGVSSIIEIAWQIFLRSRSYEAFVVCMDEPENHLHPSLQRTILPGLVDAFPNIQFIIATHSPFVVNSVREARVYALQYGADGKVSSTLLDTEDRAGSADRVLSQVLGVPVTFPVWAERQIDRILDNFRDQGATAANIKHLQDAMYEAGLQSEFPAAVNALHKQESHEA